MIKSKQNFIVHSIFPLFLGIIVYTFFRHDSVFSLPYLYINLPSDWLIFKLIKNQLTDFFWAYSFASSLLIFVNVKRIINVTFAIIITCSIEFINAKYFKQSFDWADVLVMIIGVISATFILKK